MSNLTARGKDEENRWRSGWEEGDDALEGSGS